MDKHRTVCSSTSICSRICSATECALCCFAAVSSLDLTVLLDSRLVVALIVNCLPIVQRFIAQQCLLGIDMRLSAARLATADSAAPKNLDCVINPDLFCMVLASLQ